jgi:hypothetical protein
MFGGPYFGDRVPTWAGYTVGYCLVRAFAPGHPDLTHEDLTRLPPDVFITPRFVAQLDRCDGGRSRIPDRTLDVPSLPTHVLRLLGCDQVRRLVTLDLIRGRFVGFVLVRPSRSATK